MTMLALSLKRGGLLAPFPTSHGVSVDAIRVQDSIQHVLSTLIGSLAVSLASSQALSQLREIETSAAAANWNGYGARPVDDRALAQAARFLRALPTTLAVPDVSADPDGEVDLLWFVDARRTLSVSVRGDGRLTWAALIGESSTYGTEWFSVEIPAGILQSLFRVLDANAG